MEMTWKNVLTRLIRNEHLDVESSRWWVDELMNGEADSVVVSAVLAAQQTNGLSSDEIQGAVEAMVSHALPLDVKGDVTDIVGTGGDGASTVNISTMGAIIAAGAGVKIVKHGNRAASSKSGAADCLEALGLPLDLEPQSVARVADKVGITFAFARTFHPAMKYVGPIRMVLGIPTIFNILGPLTNPAHARHMAVGVANMTLSPLIAEVFARRGQDGMVFTSSEGIDELVPTGHDMHVWRIVDNEVREYLFNPCEVLGIPAVTLDDLRGDTADYNAQIVRDVLAGKDVPSRTTALLNAAAAIVADSSLLSTRPDDLNAQFKEAYTIATAAVDSGKAQAKLTDWIEASQAMQDPQVD